MHKCNYSTRKNFLTCSEDLNFFYFGTFVRYMYIGVASLGPGGARAPPDFLKITITQTSLSAVYNKGKSEIGENLFIKLFTKLSYNFLKIFQIFFKFS